MKRSISSPVHILFFPAVILMIAVFGYHAPAFGANYSSNNDRPIIQYDPEDIAPPPVPDTPGAPEPNAIEDPALSPDSAISEPDPLIEQPEPRIEEPVPYVEEAEPYVEQTAPLVEEGEPLVNEPEPLVDEPDPLVEQPEPLVNEPEPLVDEPEPLVPQGEPLGDREAEGRGIR